MHIAGCFRRSIIVPHLCHRLPPMLFIGRSGNTVDRSLTRWVRSWRPVPAARPFGQGGMLPRYPFIRLSMNPEDYFSPHPVFHTFFAFDHLKIALFTKSLQLCVTYNARKKNERDIRLPKARMPSVVFRCPSLNSHRKDESAPPHFYWQKNRCFHNHFEIFFEKLFSTLL